MLDASLCWQSELKVQYNGRAVFSRHNDQTCSFSEKHAVAQHRNASELVIVSNDGLVCQIVFELQRVGIAQITVVHRAS